MLHQPAKFMSLQQKAGIMAEFYPIYFGYLKVGYVILEKPARVR